MAKEQGKPEKMNKILLANLILIIASPTKVFTQTIRIPVIPYEKKTYSVPTKIHNKCISIVKYSNCVKRYLREY